MNITHPIQDEIITMILSKQIRSLDRRFFVVRKSIPFFNTLYNHLLRVNVANSFHSLSKKEIIRKHSVDAIDKLLHTTKITTSDSEMPKIIWFYWHAGIDNAPSVVKIALKSWKHFNPDYTVNFVSNANLHEHLDFDFNSIFKIASVRCPLPLKADILRLYLLSKHGGVWVDATTFCLKPLTSWLPSAIEHFDLFNFKQKDNLTRPMEVWFIAAKKNHRIINETLEQYVNYITEPRKTTLYVSGKVTLIEEITEHKERLKPLLPSVSYSAANYGFMPYFSFSYFMYKSLQDNLSDRELQIYMREDENKLLTNNYALTKDPFSEFENAYVSKQTYVHSYINSDLYKKRRDTLLNLLKNID